VRSPEDTPFRFALGRDLIDATIERVQRHEGGPMFVYMHFMDPHAPYYLGGTDGTPFENYVAEIGYFDEHLTRLIDVLDAEGLAERAVFIITADHGEAFGEHDTTEHATTLYEELLRVPLVIHASGIRSRAVSEPVSTIDLGPTILDLFRQLTPGHYMGQSLVPFLRGDDPVLTRPIIAEGRLMQAIVDRTEIKVIRDLRRNTREAYDLQSDPGELESIVDDERAQRVLGRLARFFEVHTRTDDGYEVPYRR
jgi:arylsulfatase A-like enzyme